MDLAKTDARDYIRNALFIIPDVCTKLDMLPCVLLDIVREYTDYYSSLEVHFFEYTKSIGSPTSLSVALEQEAKTDRRLQHWISESLHVYRTSPYYKPVMALDEILRWSSVRNTCHRPRCFYGPNLWEDHCICGSPLKFR